MSGNGEEYPLISDLQREAFKYRLALPTSAESVCGGGGVLTAYPAGKWHPAFCHVKNRIERNLNKSLRVTSGT